MVEKIDSCTISLAMHNIYTDVVYNGVYCVVRTSPLFSVFSSLEGRKKDSFLGFPG